MKVEMSSQIYASAALALVPSFKRLDGLQSWSGRYGEEKESYPYGESKSIQPVA
jgi:hypothetical protein